MHRSSAVTLAVLMSALGASATAHEGDVGVSIYNGRLVTSLVDEGGTLAGAIDRERVFGSEFGEAGIPNFADEPGFYTDVLTPGTSIGFNILDAVRIWNGSDFSQVSPTTITVSEDSSVPGTMEVTSGAGFVAGFEFIEADANGFFDDHPDFLLDAPAGQGLGIYLLALELTSDAANDSRPFWIVFNNGQDEEDHDAAIEWVVANLVPAPGAAAGLLGALCVFSRRRRA